MDIGTISTIGRSFGLAFASGINAYLPMLCFAIANRWFHLFKVNPNFAFITQDWCIIALTVLTIIGFVADKIPVVDHVWNGIHKVLRPIAGAIVAAASFSNIPAILTTTNNSHMSVVVAAISATPVIAIGLFVIFLIGGILAAMSHTAKTTTRWVSTLTTAGVFNIVLSVIEDVMVFITTLLSLFLPIIMLIIIVLFVLLLGPRLLRAWSRLLGGRWRI